MKLQIQSEIQNDTIDLTHDETIDLTLETHQENNETINLLLDENIEEIEIIDLTKDNSLEVDDSDRDYCICNCDPSSAAYGNNCEADHRRLSFYEDLNIDDSIEINVSSRNHYNCNCFPTSPSFGYDCGASHSRLSLVENSKDTEELIVTKETQRLAINKFKNFDILYKYYLNFSEEVQNQEEEDTRGSFDNYLNNRIDFFRDIMSRYSNYDNYSRIMTPETFTYINDFINNRE